VNRKKILITGTKGFLGSNVSKYFKSLGYETCGIGHGWFSAKDLQSIGLDYWKQDDITIKSILGFNRTFDVIVHCGGSGSVSFSVECPYEDFKKTVDGTLEVLEYIRVYNPNAHLIYPSSPAVQGEHPNEPIREEYVGKPSSPYGYHKKIAEDLCQSYSEKYNLTISIIRLFSIYGIGLQKQLLWDAYHKINSAKKDVEFWGTGNETRDFIHISDVLRLFEKIIIANKKFILVNGGSGIKHTVFDVVHKIKDYLNKDIEIIFNNRVNIGNPIYYCADIEKAMMLNWQTQVLFEEKLKEYLEWVKKI